MSKGVESLGRVGIIGSGGGFRGVAIPGFLEPLIRRKIPIHYLSAVSVSALMFAKLSEARSQEDLPMLLELIKRQWREIAKIGPKAVFDFSFRNVRHVWNSDSILPNNNSLFRLLQDFDPVKSINSPIRFDFTVFDDETKEHKVFSNRDEIFKRNPELLRNAVVASASLLPIFKSTAVGSRNYYDGGFIDANGALEYGCDTIFALLPYPKIYCKTPPMDNFINRHLPIIDKFSSVCAAVLRERDAVELNKIDCHNCRIEYEKKWTKDRDDLEQALQKIALLEEKIAALEGAEGLLDRLSIKLSFWKKAFLRGKSVPKYFKPVNLKIFNAEPPETLVVSSFCRDDFEKTFQNSARQMDRELAKLLD